MERKTIVEAELIVRGDVAASDNPDAAANDFGAAVWFAGMINQSSDISARSTVEIMPEVKSENIYTSVSTFR